MAASRSPDTCSLRAVFSMKVPVPPLHADCMYTCFVFPPPVAVKKIVFMSSPPISETKRTSGCRRSTHAATATTSEEHTSELQSRQYLVCRLLLEKKNVLWVSNCR